MLAVDLWDYNIPAYCSVSEKYFGEPDNIRALAMKAKDTELLALLEKYVHGEKLVRLDEEYEQVPFLTPCDVVYQESLIAPLTNFDYKNTWDCFYYLRFDEAKIKQAVVELNGRFYRIVTGSIKNLADFSDPEWQLLGWMKWGQPGLIQTIRKDEDLFLTYRLYMTEKIYDTREEAIADCRSIDKINWAVFAADIFGDG